MRILQISDTHLGITKEAVIKRMLKEASLESFDVILHCGDYCGGTKGYKTTNATVKLIRSIFPDKPYVSVLGNHDVWHEGRPHKTAKIDAYDYYIPKKAYPSLSLFHGNLNKIKKCFAENNVHFLDTDGYYQHPDWPDVVLLGSSGWYNHPNPPTNDYSYLPYVIEGNTNRWMERNARHQLFRQMDELDKIYETHMTVCFVSHFPVIKVGEDRNFDLFSWDTSIGKMLQETYNCRHFFNGHAHQYHKGPLRYESGSDYYNPKYHIIEV